jgi:solute carrier family 25 phosphate transporter 3
MKFACFERTLEALYKYIIPKPREQYTKTEQLGFTFLAGYIAGIFCAIVSHPADTIVSKLNNEKGLGLFEAVRRVGFAGKFEFDYFSNLSSYLGLWKGLGLRIFMIGTLTALQWFLYETVKVILAVPQPPLPQYPSSLQRKQDLISDKQPLIRDSSV